MRGSRVDVGSEVLRSVDSEASADAHDMQPVVACICRTKSDRQTIDTGVF